MGLDVSHDAWSGAYSRFDRFRKAVAKACNVEMIEKDFELWWSFPEGFRDNYPGLAEFLIHSDCDGEITPDLCAELADEMESILPKIEGEDFSEQAQRWIQGCREAAKADEPLEFM